MNTFTPNRELAVSMAIERARRTKRNVVIQETVYLGKRGYRSRYEDERDYGSGRDIPGTMMIVTPYTEESEASKLKPLGGYKTKKPPELREPAYVTEQDAALLCARDARSTHPYSNDGLVPVPKSKLPVGEHCDGCDRVWSGERWR